MSAPTRRPYDPVLLVVVFALVVLGVVMVYSASAIMAAEKLGDPYRYARSHGLYATIGLLLLAVAVRIPPATLRKLAIPGFFLAAALLVLAILPGVSSSAGGASRWVRLGPLAFQPSELVKLAMVVYLAHSLARKQDRLQELGSGFVPYVVMLSALLGLMMLQPDLGGSVVLALVAMSMLLVAGTRPKHLCCAALTAVPVVIFLVWFEPYRLRRIVAFLNPWADPGGGGFQIIQSWLAVGSGGLFGRGLGESRQKLFYLPEAHTDFIFSIVGEELGLIGVTIVLVLFLLLVMRGFKLALEAKDDFCRFLAFGLSLLLGVEALVNMSVVLGIVPTKGLALPFLSYGGSSLVTSLAAAGLLLSVSAHPDGGGEPAPAPRAIERQRRRRRP